MARLRGITEGSKDLLRLQTVILTFTNTHWGHLVAPRGNKRKRIWEGNFVHGCEPSKAMHRVFGRVFLCTYLCTFIFIVFFLCASFVVYDFLFPCVHVCFRINHVEDHVENQTSGLNPDNLRSVHGKKLFDNSQYLVQTYTQLTDIPGIHEIHQHLEVCM